jgi:hypothetical protein
MIEFGVAVATDATHTVKRIDNDSLSRFKPVHLCAAVGVPTLIVNAVRSKRLLCLSSRLGTLADGQHADLPVVPVPNIDR